MTKSEQDLDNGQEQDIDALRKFDESLSDEERASLAAITKRYGKNGIIDETAKRLTTQDFKIKLARPISLSDLAEQ